MAPSYALAVMGVTGAGKSSFIKLVTGDSTIKIGHSQESETEIISSHEIYIRGRKFTLVDTPGFDDTKLKDSEVLELLIDWLASTYRSGQKLSGILYLHRITDARMRGSSLRNLNMFKQLIGDEFHKNVTLGTTCWSLVPFHIGVARETELKTSTGFWKIMISKGAQLECIPTEQSKAQDLVYEIASHEAIPLQTQRDIVDRGISYNNLPVYKMVEDALEQLRKEYEAEVRRIAKENYERRELEERARRLELERIRARNDRILEARRKPNYCDKSTPWGRVAKPDAVIGCKIICSFGTAVLVTPVTHIGNAPLRQ